VSESAYYENWLGKCEDGRGRELPPGTFVALRREGLVDNNRRLTEAGSRVLEVARRGDHE
jgi:hypothetical protein